MTRRIAGGKNSIKDCGPASHLAQLASSKHSHGGSAFSQYGHAPMRSPLQSTRDWDALHRAMKGIAEQVAARASSLTRVTAIERDLESLRQQIECLRCTNSVFLQLSTLAPDQLEVIKNIPVVLQPVDDEFLATQFDAGISTTGDTQEEAVSNLKELIVDLFESLEEDEQILGPVPA